MDQRNIIIVYCHTGSEENMRVAIKQHLHTLDQGNLNDRIIYYNAVQDSPSWSFLDEKIGCEIPKQLRAVKFDVVILHTTFLGYRWTGSYFYRWKEHFAWIAEINALKIAIPQDEYDRSEILDEWLYAWGVTVVFTNFGKEYRQQLYPIMCNRAAFHECYTGYICEEKATCSGDGSWAENGVRQKDIVYRAKELPFWFGSHGQLKHEIASVVNEKAKLQGLKTDISTRGEDVIFGDQWFDFLASGRTVLGCESGSSVLDKRGERQSQVKAIQNKDGAQISFKELSARMPSGWDDYCFYAISPRHFEAISTKTCQVLIEGYYNGVLIPNIHYIPLKKDFSNIDATLDLIKDKAIVQKIAERAYRDIYLCGKYTYRAFSEQIWQVIEEHLAKHDLIKKEERGSMNGENKALDILERQLIAERHRNELLWAKLNEANANNGENIANITLKVIIQMFRQKKLMAVFIFAFTLIVGLIVSNTVLIKRLF